MDTYAKDPIARTSQEKPTSFMIDVQHEVTEIRQRLGTFTDRLYSAGFFGPPENASACEPQCENNHRSNIISDFEVIRNQLRVLDHQLARVVG